MPETTKRIVPRRKLLRFVLYSFGTLILLVGLLFYALTLPVVQQRLTRTAETFSQKKLGTSVRLGAVRVQFPTTVSLEGFLLEDEQGDTLARIGSLSVRIGMWKLLDQTIELQQITLENARIYLHTRDSVSNYDFIVRAFAANSSTAVPKDTTSSAWKLQLDLAQLQLRQVDFLLLDEDAGSTTQAYIGTAKTTIATVDLKKRYFELQDFSLDDSEIKLIQKKKTVDNGKPDQAFSLLLKNADICCSHLVYSTLEQAINAHLVKTTLDQMLVSSANDLLSIQAKGILVENSEVAYRDPEIAPSPGHFNAGDLDLSALHAILPDFSFQHDSVFIQADALSGEDKSGLKLHTLRATTKITPGSIELRNVLASLNETSINGDAQLFKNQGATFNRMQVQLRQLNGKFGDLLVLLPPMENTALNKLQDLPYALSGNISGWLDKLQTERIRFQAGKGTVANFSGSVERLTEPTKLGMHLNISQLATNREDLLRWMSLGDTPRDSLLLQPLPAYLNASGSVNGAMSGLQLSLEGKMGALQTGPEFPRETGPPLEFKLAGTMSDVNDPDLMRMDLQINQLDAPQSFFAFLSSETLQLPDLVQATGALQGSLSALNLDLKFHLLRDGTSSQLAFKGLLSQLRTPAQLGFDMHFNGSLARQEILGYLPDSLLRGVLHLPDFTQVNGLVKGTIKDAA